MALCAIAAGCGGSIGGGQAACAAIEPRVEAEPARAAPTETFVLRGEGFADYSGRGGLVGGECPRLLPDRGIRVEFVQGAKTWELARIDGGEDLAFEAKLEVPAEAGPGEAVVRASSRGTGLPEAPPPAEAPFLVPDSAAGGPAGDRARDRRRTSEKTATHGAPRKEKGAHSSQTHRSPNCS